MLEQVEAETGLICSVIVGGPEPRHGGQPVVMRYWLFAINSLPTSLTYHQFPSRKDPRWERLRSCVFWLG
jgi:hypothetical protein